MEGGEEEEQPSTRVSPSSSFLLVLLHPHQRIITPLPHCNDSVTFDNNNDDDNSGYTNCQESLQSQNQQ